MLPSHFLRHFAKVRRLISVSLRPCGSRLPASLSVFWSVVVVVAVTFLLGSEDRFRNRTGNGSLTSGGVPSEHGHSKGHTGGHGGTSHTGGAHGGASQGGAHTHPAGHTGIVTGGNGIIPSRPGGGAHASQGPGKPSHGHGHGGKSHGHGQTGGGGGGGQGHMHGHGGGQGHVQLGQNTLMMVVLLQHFPGPVPLCQPGYGVGPPGGVTPPGGVGVGGSGASFSCVVSTLVSVFACANTFTLAAALAPLLALDEVAIRVFTLVFVNVCDSDDESDAVAAPVPAAVFAPPEELESARLSPVPAAGACLAPPAGIVSARVLPVSAAGSLSASLRLKRKKNFHIGKSD